jgi:hypothetical protein
MLYNTTLLWVLDLAKFCVCENPIHLAVIVSSARKINYESSDIAP